MIQRLLPVLYALEFLLTLIAVYTVWGEVAGPDYLDSIPWYWRAAIGFATAGAAVRLTIATARSARPRVAIWALVLASLALGAGVLTYYYYVNEPTDDPDAPASATPTASLAGTHRG